MNPVSLAEVLSRADVWRGGAVAPVAEAGLGSGFAALDAVLPGGGWPSGALVELLLAGGGFGELSLLLPALAVITRRGGWVAAIQPPQSSQCLHAPAWQAAGVDLARLVVVEPSGADVLWAGQQILQAGSIEALLAWLPAGTPTQALRRLQLAAESGGRTAFVFRPAACAGLSSPAPLRLALTAREGCLAVQVIKRRGAPLAAPVYLAVPRPVDVSRHALVGPQLSAPAAGSPFRPALV